MFDYNNVVNADEGDDSSEDDDPIEISNKSKVAIVISKVVSIFLLSESILLLLSARGLISNLVSYIFPSIFLLSC